MRVSVLESGVWQRQQYHSPAIRHGPPGRHLVALGEHRARRGGVRYDDAMEPVGLDAWEGLK